MDMRTLQSIIGEGERGGKRLPCMSHCATETQFLADGVGGVCPMIFILWAPQCKASCLLPSTAIVSAQGSHPDPELKETNV